jgi:ubiquinone/menaquinone biosynthesis C-methylase UbiE
VISSLASTSDRISSIAAAFDALAPDYDAAWTDGFVGRLQRGQVWRVVSAIFCPGSRVLELGCGTGMDAACLAGTGVQVHATDISPEMLRAARVRIEREGLCHRVTFELRAAEQLSDIGETELFDGAFSNFGVFNCVKDLRAAASGLAGLLRPGGMLVLCLMGRFCAWETVWYLLHGRPRQAFRRLRAARDGIETSLKSGFRLRVFYPSVAELVAAFQEDFTLVSFRSIGVLVTPSYMERWASTKRRVFNRLALLDEHVGQWPVLRGAGDHRLVILARKNQNEGNAGVPDSKSWIMRTNANLKR